MLESIRIYHTNDIHSHFGDWTKIHRYVRERRREVEASGAHCFVFDIGDHVDRSHPYTEATYGKGNIQALNEAQYDAVTIGNNEGITLSHEALQTLYKDATFDVLLANVKERGGHPLQWANPYQIYTTKYGTRIAVFGLTAPYPMAYRSLGWDVTSPYEETKVLLEQLKYKADVIICLSHLGIRADRTLAKQFPAIDIILGGHTHHLLERGEWVGDTLLAAAGKYGRYIGRIDVVYDRTKRLLIKSEASVRATASLLTTQTDIEEARQYMKIGKEALNEPVFWNDTRLSNELFDKSELATLFGEALLDYTQAHCAMFNAGILLGHLKRGCVTRGDLHALLPHPINPVVAEVDGSVLYHLYAKSQDETFTHSIVTGLGFRGTYMGALLFQRMEERDGILYVGNERVLHGRTYTLATLDMFTFGFFFPELEHVPKRYFMPELLRDVFKQYVEKTMETKEC